MLSKRGKEIKNDIINVSKGEMEIDSLLQKYDKKPDRDFIQKYAETEMANVGVDAYWFSIITAIFAIILSIALTFYPDYYKSVSLIGFFYGLVLLILFVLYLYPLNYFINRLTGKNIFKDIIIEVEDVNMQTNNKEEPNVIPKLDEIISKVDKINPRIEALENKLSK